MLGGYDLGSAVRERLSFHILLPPFGFFGLFGFFRLFHFFLFVSCSGFVFFVNVLVCFGVSLFWVCFFVNVIVFFVVLYLGFGFC